MQESEVWNWQDNDYTLQIKGKDTSQIWNCSPYIMIYSIFESMPNAEMVVNIEMERTFEIDSKFGWGWHKSRYIPAIDISCTLIDKLTMSEIAIPVAIKAKLTSVVLIDNGEATFEEIELIGDSVVQMEKSSVRLEKLKFKCTSYIHKVIFVHRRDVKYD